MRSLLSLLRIDWFRYHFVKARYLLLRRKIRVLQSTSSKIGETTLEHNLGAFEHNAAFGCGGRMGLLIYPVIAFHSFHGVDRSRLKALMVGCRTEDDIYWMKAYGFLNTIGFDLISYSSNVLIGDIHDSGLADQSFDIVVLGWMISYTHDPASVVRECGRLLKPGGLIAIGIEHDPNQKDDIISPPRVNPLNTTTDLVRLLTTAFDHQVIFQYDHHNQASGDFSTAVVSLRR
jgi:SAM-dependent methyltransferase